MEDVPEQLETVDQPRPRPREVRRCVDRDDPARVQRGELVAVPAPSRSARGAS